MKRSAWNNVSIAALLAVSTLQAFAQTVPGVAPASSQAEDLRFVVVVTRHGVRSPTGKTDQMNQYSAQPWPAWPVAPGYLTEHGAKLMTLFGAYDRQLWWSQGLLSAHGCDDASHIAIFADSDQRTRETGKALAAGLTPGCSSEVHALAEGTPDPLFHPLGAGTVHGDKDVATAAIAGRIGNNPAGLVEAYDPQLRDLEDVLATAAPGSVPNQHRQSLFDIPSSLAPGKGDHLVDLRSPLGTAATISENLLLEYTEGMPVVGWGKVDSQKVRDLLQLHTASADLERRTSYLARLQSSPLLSRVLESLQQAVTQKEISGALSKPSDRVLILVGHDTNLTNISGALDLSWLIDGRRDDTPPGGAIVFELWQRRGKGDYSVRTFYEAQTLEQMRDLSPLTLASPPEKVAVFVPGCGSADDSCTWTGFQSVVRSAIGFK